MSFLSKFKGLDLHPKFREDFVEKTRSGGVVTIFTLVVVVFLTLSNIVSYVSPPTIDRMSVDSERNVPIRINFDVTFPSLSCSLVSLDAMDVSGHSHGDIVNNIFKKRLDENGNPFDQTIKNELGNSVTKKEQLGVSPSPAPEGSEVCGSCYGAGAVGQCCSTCEEVQALYIQKGWSFDPAVVTQCSKRNLEIDSNSKEGCNVYGFVEVPRVAGNIHFAPGKSFQSADMHVHDLMSYTFQVFNTSHRINAFSFSVGEGPSHLGVGAASVAAVEAFAFVTKNKPTNTSVTAILGPVKVTNPLEGYQNILPKDQGNGMFQYYVKVVPTDYVVGSNKVSTYQYSVTQYFRPVSIAKGNGLPGVFFFYDLSSIRVTVEPHGMTLGHLLTNLCAIAGGIITVMGVVDQGVYRLMRYIKSRQTFA